MRLLTKLLIGVIIFSLVSCNKNRDTICPESLQNYVNALDALADRDLTLANSLSKRALTKNPDFFSARVLSAKLSWFLGDIECAKKILNAGSRMVNENSIGSAGLLMAKLYRANGNMNDAKKQIDRLLNWEPDNPAVLRVAAQIAQDQNNVSASLAFLNRGIETTIEIALLYFERAKIFWAIDEGVAALRDLDLALCFIPIGSEYANKINTMQEVIKNVLSGNQL
jgi:tetratricopeptide (TPR) repeat protein